MTIFMYLFLPLILTLFCFCYRSKKNIPVLYIGIMASIILCAIKMLFFYSHRIVPYSFTENFVYFLIRETLLPSVIIYGLFFCFSKDTLEFKLCSVFPLLTSFYVIYMPFCIVNAASGYMNSFSLFIKPILIGIMLITLGLSAREIFKYLQNKKYLFVSVYSLVIIIYLLVPAALESLYLINTSIIWSIICTVLYSAFPITLSVLKTLKIIKQ